MKIKLELFGVCREFSEQDYLDFDFELNINTVNIQFLQCSAGEPIPNIQNCI